MFTQSLPRISVSPSALSPAMAKLMAMRWSRWLSMTAPWSGLPPWMIMPSSVALISAPIAERFFTITSIRFDSFTFSSCASLITVCPFAKHAMMAMIGISSISFGIREPSITQPFKSEVCTVMSAAGSPG